MECRPFSGWRHSTDGARGPRTSPSTRRSRCVGGTGSIPPSRVRASANVARSAASATRPAQRGTAGVDRVAQTATPARSPTTTPSRHAVPGLTGQPRRHRTVLGRPRPPGTASTSTPNRPDHRWAAETRGATPAGRRRPSVRRPTKTEWQTPGAPAAQGDNAPRDRDRLRDTQEIDPRVSSFSC